MDKEQESKYYKVRASVFWLIVVAIIGVFSIWTFLMNSYEKKENELSEQRELERVEYGTIKSRLENISECYLCGNSNLSLMGYYRKFDTVGIIALNEWYVLDLRLKEYDQNGKEMFQSEHSNTVIGNNQGIRYQVNSTPSRGMATATISSNKGMFDEEVIRKNLCQKCLDKVARTLVTYCEIGKKEEYIPFCVIDFETLEVYPLQTQNLGYFVRDYWIDVEHKEDELKVQIFYLPGYD